jgi:hypothetical protein
MRPMCARRPLRCWLSQVWPAVALAVGFEPLLEQRRVERIDSVAAAAVRRSARRSGPLATPIPATPNPAPSPSLPLPATLLIFEPVVVARGPGTHPLRSRTRPSACRPGASFGSGDPRKSQTKRYRPAPRGSGFPAPLQHPPNDAGSPTGTKVHHRQSRLTPSVTQPRRLSNRVDSS